MVFTPMMTSECSKGKLVGYSGTNRGQKSFEIGPENLFGVSRNLCSMSGGIRVLG